MPTDKSEKKIPTNTKNVVKTKDTVKKEKSKITVNQANKESNQTVPKKPNTSKNTVLDKTVTNKQAVSSQISMGNSENKDKIAINRENLNKSLAKSTNLRFLLILLGMLSLIALSVLSYEIYRNYKKTNLLNIDVEIESDKMPSNMDYNLIDEARRITDDEIGIKDI